MLALAHVHPHDGHAVTHHHGRHAIAHNVRILCPPDCNDPQHDADDDQPVAVSDLLDAYEARDANSNDAYQYYRRARARAGDDVWNSYHNVRAALSSYRRHEEFIAELSPEERAEFDRRTT